MPTPGGLPKAGDKLVYHTDEQKVIYIVVERTSTTAPFSVWIRREDNRVISGFRSENLRRRGLEARLSCETGILPGHWRNYVPSLDRSTATSNDSDKLRDVRAAFQSYVDSRPYQPPEAQMDLVNRFLNRLAAILTE